MNEEFIRVYGSLQVSRGGKVFSKDLNNANAYCKFMHTSRFKGEVRIFESLAELSAECDFKDAATYFTTLFRIDPDTSPVAVAEDTVSGLWYVLSDGLGGGDNNGLKANLGNDFRKKQKTQTE